LGIEAIVKGRQKGDAQAGQQGKVHPVNVAMHDVELRRGLGNGIKLRGIGRHRIWTGPAQSHRARDNRDEPAACNGIPACEQSYLMSQSHQLFREPGDDTLCATIEFRGNALGKRRDLSNTHAAPKAR
jgi:hypothetical protein